MPRRKKQEPVVEKQAPVKKRHRRTKAEMEAARQAEAAAAQQPEKRRKRKVKAPEKAIVEAIVKKRKRRTKAEMEAARQQQASIPVINRVKSEEAVVKVRRKRRTKAEMEASKKQEEVDDRKYIDEVLKRAKSKETILRFHNYIISKFDESNLSLEYKPKEESAGLFLGYYAFTMDGFIRALEMLASRLLMGVTNSTKANAISNLNVLLMALHDFKLFLHNKFVMAKDGR